MARRKNVRYKFYVDRDFNTTYRQDKETGKMEGRKRINGFGDRTAVKRVSSPAKFSGQIFGRTHPIPVRGDSGKRGTIRRTI